MTEIENESELSGCTIQLHIVIIYYAHIYRHTHTHTNVLREANHPNEHSTLPSCVSAVKTVYLDLSLAVLRKV